MFKIIIVIILFILMAIIFIDEFSKFNSKIYKDTINQQNYNGETVLEPDLASNDSFFLDISKLKRKFNLNHVYINSIIYIL